MLVTTLDDKLFVIPTISENGVAVNIDIGICECMKGRDGTVCKHEYILWTNTQVKGYTFYHI